VKNLNADGDNIKVDVKEIGCGVMGLFSGLMWLRIVCIL
jgi:hypothetical protein